MQAVPRRSTAGRRIPPAAALLALLAIVAGCDTALPSPSSSVTPRPTLAAARPAVQIDETWTALNGEWTFTGRVDPQGDATDVVLEVGPGPQTARTFDTRVTVEDDLTIAGPVTITTRAIPDIDEICVRFSAANSGGTSSTQPLCFPHDLPSIPLPGAPTVSIDPTWTFADGAWSFTARLDPNRAETDLVLETGPGPAANPRFTESNPVSQDVIEGAAVTFSTTNIPDADVACVRFTATNEHGSASSEPLCFDPNGPPPS